MSELELPPGFVETVSLTSAAADLAAAKPGAKGYVSKVLVKTSDLRLVLFAMEAGSLVPQHHSEGRIVVHCLKGGLRMQMPAESKQLHEGDVLVLDRRVPHDVKALEDSIFLLTICLPNQ